MPDINALSICSVQVLPLSENKSALSTASGLICNYKERVILITNWHVASGRNYQTDDILNSDQWTPEYLRIRLPIAVRKGDRIMSFHKFLDCDVELLGESGNQTSHRWFEHPEHGRNVDVVGLDVTYESGISQSHGHDVALPETSNVLSVMSRLFIVGHPLKSSVSPNQFPIYKSGTIASEPSVYDNVPMFLIDSKTKRGMSGSPVFRVEEAPAIAAGETLFGGRKAASIGVRKKTTIDLVGIYSGREREEKELNEAELGIVWPLKECVFPILDRIIAGNK